MVPIVNENDTVADDEIRYGDNDRIAALVANMVRADLLVLLTDTAGLFTADPRLDAEASLIEEIAAVDEALESVAGGTGLGAGERRHGDQARGGQDRVVVGRARGDRRGRPARRARPTRSPGEPVGTVVQPHAERLPSRKLWIAFAVGAVGPGRRRRRRPARAGLAAAARCWPPGCGGSRATFDADAAVEVVGDDGRVVRQGPGPLLRAATAGGRRAASGDLPDGAPAEVVHRDDLVVLNA